MSAEERSATATVHSAGTILPASRSGHRALVSFCLLLGFVSVLPAAVKKRRALLLTLFIAAGLLDAPAASHTVRMSGFQFVPRTLSIAVGDSVTWINDDFTSHDTVSGVNGVPSGVWNSNDQFGRLMRFGESFTFTFNNSGTFPYYCTPHWASFQMTGTITVQAANAPPAVSIQSPSPGQTYTAPANVAVSASASDSDGSIALLELFLNGSRFGAVNGRTINASTNGLGAGAYTVTAVARDNAGAVASNSISITVTGAAPAIVSAPQSQTVSAGSSVAFNVSAAGSAPLFYQWFFENNPVAGATGTSLVRNNVTTDDSGEYSVTVSNSFGTASASATLVVTNPPEELPPAILTHPQSQVVMEGSNVLFSVSASGSVPLLFQWFFNEEPLPGATNSILILSNVFAAQAGEYFATVSNAFGADTSGVATLTVTSAPVCAFALSSTATNLPPGGGAVSVELLTEPGCTWEVMNPAPWVQLAGPSSGTGPVTLQFTIQANTALEPRTAVVSIAGETFSINQAATRFPARNDFDRDGYTDLLWQGPDGRLALWLMEGVQRRSAFLLRGGQAIAAGWLAAGTADMNGDGHVDIVWQHASGRLAVWLMRRTGFVRAELISAAGPGPGWRLIGPADLDGDGFADLLFRHEEGYLLQWRMHRLARVHQALMFDEGEPVPGEWSVAGAGNFNRDAHVDLLWQNGSGALVLWEMNGGEPAAGIDVTAALRHPDARVIGIADINRDGNPDLLSRQTDHRLFVSFLNGTRLLGRKWINQQMPVSPRWRLVAP